MPKRRKIHFYFVNCSNVELPNKLKRYLATLKILFSLLDVGKIKRVTLTLTYLWGIEMQRHVLIEVIRQYKVIYLIRTENILQSVLDD